MSLLLFLLLSFTYAQDVYSTQSISLVTGLLEGASAIDGNTLIVSLSMLNGYYGAAGLSPDGMRDGLLVACYVPANGPGVCNGFTSFNTNITPASSITPTVVSATRGESRSTIIFTVPMEQLGVTDDSARRWIFASSTMYDAANNRPTGHNSTERSGPNLSLPFGSVEVNNNPTQLITVVPNLLDSEATIVENDTLMVTLSMMNGYYGAAGLSPMGMANGSLVACVVLADGSAECNGFSSFNTNITVNESITPEVVSATRGESRSIVVFRVPMEQLGISDDSARRWIFASSTLFNTSNYYPTGHTPSERSGLTLSLPFGTVAVNNNPTQLITVVPSLLESEATIDGNTLIVTLAMMNGYYGAAGLSDDEMAGVLVACFVPTNGSAVCNGFTSINFDVSRNLSITPEVVSQTVEESRSIVVFTVPMEQLGLSATDGARRWIFASSTNYDTTNNRPTGHTPMERMGLSLTIPFSNSTINVPMVAALTVVASGSITIDAGDFDFGQFAEGGEDFADARMAFSMDIATALGLSSSNINVTSIRSGSLIVDYDILLPSNDSRLNDTSALTSFIDELNAVEITTASLPMLIQLIQNSTEMMLNFTVTSTPLVPNSELFDNGSGGLSGGAIAGIVIGSTAFVLIVIGIIGGVAYAVSRKTKVQDIHN